MRQKEEVSLKFTTLFFLTADKTMDFLEYSVTEARARLEGAGNQIE